MSSGLNSNWNMGFDGIAVDGRREGGLDPPGFDHSIAKDGPVGARSISYLELVSKKGQWPI